MTERVLFFDLVGGAAGDMLTASLLDVGVPLSVVEAAVAALGVPGLTVRTEARSSAGLRALGYVVEVSGQRVVHPGDGAAEDASPDRFDAHAHDHGHAHGHDHGQGHGHDHDHGHEHGHGLGADRAAPLSAASVPTASPRVAPVPGPVYRDYRDVQALLRAAPLPDAVRAFSERAFRYLAEAEAHAHGIPVESVHFHEVGADDALADVVGFAAALAHLDVQAVGASPPPMGRGIVQGAHGPIPLPAPATAHLLSEVPLATTELRGETVTPTGAALLKAAVDHYGALPSLTLLATGTGAGRRSWPDRPNVVRAFLGTRVSDAEASPGAEGREAVVETNLDDVLPQDLPVLLERLLAAGAADAWVTPILMKKGRPGYTVTALGTEAAVTALSAVFFGHSPTLGVRVRSVERMRAPRTLDSVALSDGVVRIKTSPSGTAMPEFDDCLALATQRGVSVAAVRSEALRAYWSQTASASPGAS